MKKILVLMLMLSSLTAQARPGGFDRGHGHRPGPAPRPVVIERHDHRHSGPDWLGPALIFGTAVATISILNQEPKEKVVIVERSPEVRIREVRDEIRGTSAKSFTLAESNWERECRQWKDELEDSYRVMDASCGVMKCVRDGRAYCYSQGEASVKVRY